MCPELHGLCLLTLLCVSVFVCVCVCVRAHVCKEKHSSKQGQIWDDNIQRAESKRREHFLLILLFDWKAKAHSERVSFFCARRCPSVVRPVAAGSTFMLHCHPLGEASIRLSTSSY